MRSIESAMLLRIIPVLCSLLLPEALPAMQIIVRTAGSQAVSGDFTTSLTSVTPLGPGLPPAIATLFETDYSGYDYVDSRTAADGDLTVSSLSVFQNGVQGGLAIDAGFLPANGARAPHIYDWVQYVTITPLTSPFEGAASSPFTDPPPLNRDDNAPFYWTASQRSTAGLGYLAGGDMSGDPIFSDSPRMNDSRAPAQMNLFLYLTDFNSAGNTVTVYGGVEYGFSINTIPEPPSGVLVLGVLIIGVAFRRAGRLYNC